MRRLALAAALVAGCGDPPRPVELERDERAPLVVVAAFYEALGAGDLPAAEALVAPFDERYRDALRKDLERVAAWMQQGIFDAAALEERIEGDWALVVTRHALRDEGGVEDARVQEQLVVRTDVGWRVVALQPVDAVRRDAVLGRLWDEDAERLLDWFRSSHATLDAEHR